MKQWMINIIVFVLVSFAIIIALLNVSPFEITGDAYIGIIITLLSIITAFIIGYQIYNSIEFKKEIVEQRERYEDILQKNQEFEKNITNKNAKFKKVLILFLPL